MAFSGRFSRADLDSWAPEGSFSEAERYVAGGRLAGLACTPTALRAAVEGSGSRPYRVILTWGGGRLAPHCTCPAFRRTPWCKHALAVALAWLVDASGFAEEEDSAAEARTRLGKKAKREAADKHALVLAGLATVERLLAELGQGGLTALSRERLATLDELAAQIGAYKLKRLQGLVYQLRNQMELALANHGRFRPSAYHEVLADLHFTVLALRRHFAGEALPADQLEDLLGKVWQTRTLPEARFARLWELAFERSLPADDFILEISHLVDPATGLIYQERQSRPARARWGSTVEPKEPYGEQPLEEVVARLYPLGSPRRLKITASERAPRIVRADLAGLLAAAESSVEGLVGRLANAAADPLQPRFVYCLFRPRAIVSDGRANWAVDSAGLALPLAPREWGFRPGLRFNGERTDLRPLLRARAPLLFGFAAYELPLAERGVRYHPLGAVDLDPPPGADLLLHFDDQARQAGRWS